MSDIFEIGTKVYVFDTEKQEPEIVEDMICGSFINIESGDLYYYTTKFKQPHYATASSLDEAKQKLEKFLEFRKFVRDAQASVDEKRNELMGNVNFKSTIEKYYEEQSAQPSVTQEPANE